MSGSNNISRSFLSIVRMTLSNKEIDVSSIAVLDSGSEVNITTPRCCQLLRLKGEAIVLNIIRAGGITSRVQTKRVELIVKDKSVVGTLIECIVLSKASRRAPVINEAVIPSVYLPLLVVTNMDRESTKVRICLDAKCKYNGVSFNDALSKGKLEMTDIFQVLTGFRFGKFTI